ncbi:MAG: lipid-A-disaccharide synthase [Rhodospirillaceae bacterium]|nr:lipid-A-disaccharide synthase [Rhodospirillaceae bacterium]
MTPHTAPSSPLGIVAGAGALPRILAKACRDQGRGYFILGLAGFVDRAALGEDPAAVIRIGQAGRGFALMLAAGVREIVMAGHIRRPTWRTLWPDWRTAKFYARLGWRALGDNALLEAVIGEIEREGFRVIGAHEVCPDLLAPEGHIGGPSPDAVMVRQIAVGIRSALDLGQRDIGQAVIVAGDAVIDREDARGTDALLARASASGRAKGGVLVKMKKPQQDRRVDLPTIGARTVRNTAAAGLGGIAIEAGHCLVIDRAEVAAAAAAAGILVTGVTAARAEGGRATTAIKPRVYLIACEPSGDQLGAMLIKAMHAETGGNIEIIGIGGEAMTAVGFKTLFDPSELALLGIFEVLPKAALVLRRVRETMADIDAQHPDILITIDSWGFTGRIHERLSKAGSPIKRLRYVAPQVWAWRPGRAKQLARWIEHLLALFPFEPPFFEKYGLATSWVGHPVLESGAGKGDGAGFRRRHGIGADEKVLIVLPGSRMSEVTHLDPVFGETVQVLASRIPNLRVVVPTVPGVAAWVNARAENWPGRPVIVTAPGERFDAFAAGDAALAASGTVTLELAMAGVPHVIAYRVNALSAMAFRLLRRTRFVNLINILLDRACVHERLQGECRADILAKDVERLLTDETVRATMRADFAEALDKLRPPGGLPSTAAARAILSVMKS